METRKIYIETYGCQMNLADTELLIGLLKPHGYESTPTAAHADVILLNTCAIREHAEERVLKRLKELVHHKTRRPGVRLGLTGCMAQHYREQLLAKAPFLDLVLGPDAYRNLPSLLEQEAPDEPLVSVRLDRDETYADITPVHGEGIRAWVTVMRGCDKFCTFCVVPYVRGRERSVPLTALLEQVGKVGIPITIGIHGLAEIDDFLIPLGDECVDLLKKCGERHTALAASHIGNNAEGAKLIAPAHDGDPCPDALSVHGGDVGIRLVAIQSHRDQRFVWSFLLQEGGEIPVRIRP